MMFLLGLLGALSIATVFFIGFWFVCAVFTAVVASSKRRSSLIWFILGLFFGLFAFIAVCAMPARERALRIGRARIQTESPKICVNCQTANSRAWTHCQGCGLRI